MRYFRFLLCFSVVMGAPLVSFADELSELKAKMQVMMEQMHVMQERIQQLEATTPPPQDSDAIAVSLEPAPKFKSADGAFEAKVSGYAQVETVFHNDDTIDAPNSTAIRRARLGLAGKMFDDWGYKFVYDFANNSRLRDLFFTYNGINDVQLIVGQYKEPFGLEWQNSSKHAMFMEAPFTSALTPRRSIGAGAKYRYGDIGLHVGLFGENANQARSDDEGYSVGGHLVYTPVHDTGRHLHIGGSLSHRVPDAASDAVSFSAALESSSAITDAVATGAISEVDHSLLSGVEALGIWESFLLQAEYVQMDVERDAGLAQERFASYYLHAAYMLSGESRIFNPNKHGFARVVPEHPFTLSGEGYGACEIAARFEHLDLNDNAIQAGEAERFVVGLNWYPNRFTRLMLNYSLLDTDENAVLPNDNSQAIAARAQIEF